MEKARIDDLALDIPAVCEHLWQVIGNLGIMRNRALIVSGTKALHHVPPDLVPPMDCAWTGRSFSGQPEHPQNAQAATFTWMYTGLAQVGRAVKPAEFTEQGWRTSRS